MKFVTPKVFVLAATCIQDGMFDYLDCIGGCLFSFLGHERYAEGDLGG